MLKFAVVEDNDNDFETFQNALNSFFESSGQECCNLTRYTNAEDFLKEYKQDSFDLIFMDIDLGAMNGVTCAKNIRTFDSNIPIVFLTNLSHYALNGYEVNALDYILKPISSYSFALKMPRILHLMSLNNEKQITISTKSYLQRLYISEIFYIEVNKHDLIYHTKKGIFTERATMKSIEETLENCHFCKCNTCYLVNLKHVSQIKDNFVVVGGDSLIISRNRKVSFINSLTDYIGGQL